MMPDEIAFNWAIRVLCTPYLYVVIYVVVGLISLGYYIRDLETKPTPRNDPWPGIIVFSVAWPVVMIGMLGWHLHAWWHAPPLPPIPPEQPLKGP